jgi:hypothetical protein
MRSNLYYLARLPRRRFTPPRNDSYSDMSEKFEQHQEYNFNFKKNLPIER